MDTLAARRLDECVIAVPFDMSSETERYFDHISEREARRRVDIPHNVVRVFEVGLAGVNLVQLNAGEVRQPYQCRVFGCDGVFDNVCLAQGNFLYPAWSPIRKILLKERLAGDAVRESDQRQRPALNVT